MNDDLSTALGDLAETMTDDPRRLTAVHRRARQLRARRAARRGAAGVGALGVAAATGVLLRPSGPAPDTRVTATQPTGPAEPAATASTVVPPCASTPTTTRPASDHPILTTFARARVLGVDGDDVTLELLDQPADSALPATLTVTLGAHVEYADGDTRLDRADLAAGQLVEIVVQQPQGSAGWELAYVQIDPVAAADGELTVPDC